MTGAKISWGVAQRFRWRAQNEWVEAAAQATLAGKAGTLTTRDLAEAIAGKDDLDKDAFGYLMAALLRVAPLLGKQWASHDGEKYWVQRARRHFRRWQWHGQLVSTDGEKSNDRLRPKEQVRGQDAPARRRRVSGSGTPAPAGCPTPGNGELPGEDGGSAGKPAGRSGDHSDGVLGADPDFD